eukprot:247625-Chlamydomonas_euryale.AAC.1
MQAERAKQLRKAELSMLAQVARLDDVAKEEQLRQVAAAEAAHERNLESLRSEWAAQLAQMQADVQHQQQIMAYTLKAKEEVGERRRSQEEAEGNTGREEGVTGGGGRKYREGGGG